MNQLGNKIEIALAKDVQWVHQNRCQATDENKFFRYLTDDISIEQNNEAEDTDPVFSQTATIVTSMTKAEQQLFHNQNIIIRLTTLRDGEIIWGTKAYPVHCIITPELDNVSLNLTCQSPEPLPY